MGGRVVELEQRTQVEESTYVNLLPPFWGKPRVASLLRSYAREAARVEDACWLLFQMVDVAQADLPRLVLLGRLIGQARHGLSEDQFRRAIVARALANRSQGTLGDLFAILNSLLGAVAYAVVETGNASLSISALDPLSEDDVAVVREVLPFARAGGVGLNFGYATEDDAPGGSTFIWGDVFASDEYWGTVVVL